MPIESTSSNLLLNNRLSALSFVFFILGLSVFFFFHLYDISSVPGLHYDEAWSANYAYELSQGHFSWRGMSPFTLPWEQYWVAVGYKLFGVNLAVFRISHLMLVFIGFFITLSVLFRHEYYRTLVVFPWVLTILPGLVTNHRFGIELTGWHVFSFSLVLLGLSLCSRGPNKNLGRAVIAMGAIFGLTGHVLFLAPLVSLYLVLMLREYKWKIRDRWLVQAVAFVLFIFSLGILIQVPSKAKPIALMLGALLVMVHAQFGFPVASWLRDRKRIVWGILVVASIPFLFNALFFLDGHWGFLRAHGTLLYPRFIAITVVGLLGLFWKAYSLGALKGEVWAFVQWTGLTTLMLGLIMLKPSPRYYELSLFCLALLGSYCVTRLEVKKAVVLVTLFTMLASTSIWWNYFMPAQLNLTSDREFRFLLFSDSSRDFLSKQRLVRFMADRGCGFESLIIEDNRVLEAVRFLRHGDWKPATTHPCPGKFRVEREAKYDKIPDEVEMLGGFFLVREE